MGRDRKAFVWKHAHVEQGDLVCDVKNAEGQPCGKKFKYMGSNSNMMKHLREEHHLTEAAEPSAAPTRDIRSMLTAQVKLIAGEDLSFARLPVPDQLTVLWAEEALPFALLDKDRFRRLEWTAPLSQSALGRLQST